MTNYDRAILSKMFSLIIRAILLLAAGQDIPTPLVQNELLQISEESGQFVKSLQSWSKIDGR